VTFNDHFRIICVRSLVRADNVARRSSARAVLPDRVEMTSRDIRLWGEHVKRRTGRSLTYTRESTMIPLLRDDESAPAKLYMAELKRTKLILGYFFLKRIKNIVLNMNYFFIKNKLPSVRS